ncbi:MAG: hypothetical protein ABIO17_07260 [Pseudoxanthomonas sp.]
MSQNLISLTITEEQQAAALVGLAQIEAALPNLLSLDPDERRRMTYMGDKSEVFTRQTIRVLQQNPQIVPPSLNLTEAQADLQALDRLRPVLERLQRLIAQVEDTTNALGSDAMSTALEGYGQIKLSGASHGLEELRKEIGGRWARGPRKPVPVAG